MKVSIFIFSIFVFNTFSAFGQEVKHVLFLGNSYTNYNDLPYLVGAMASSVGDELVYDSNTPGGSRFLTHASNSTSLSKISSQDWDYVVLQGQSQETSYSPSQLQTDVYPYVESLCEDIRANNDCSEPMFFMTWGRKNGDASNCEFLPWVCTYEGMDDAIADTYTFMGSTNNTEVSPVGAVWRRLRNNNPEIELYNADNSHPSLKGSYAAACTFYAMIFKKDPTLITWNSTLDESEASTIKTAAKIVAFNNSDDWDFTENPAEANFEFNQSGANLSFSNTSSSYDSLMWDFDDGNTSNSVNPDHFYTQSGIYNVSLTVTKCGKTNTKTETIEVILSAVSELLIPQPQIFPNPFYKSITINLDGQVKPYKASIFDLSGKEYTFSTTENNASFKLNLQELNAGIYVLKLLTEKGEFSHKVVKY